MVASQPLIRFGNRLLDQLPSVERRALAGKAERIELDAGQTVCAMGSVIRHVYFPQHGTVLLSARVAGGPALGVGLVRRDGMFGMSAVMGRSKSNTAATSQGAGSGSRMEANTFRALLDICPGFRSALLTHACIAQDQMAQNAACVAFHSARQRIARWMLDVTDDAIGAAFTATQSSMASLLALQRPAVSVVASALQRAGVIHYLRGEITILDRTALRAAACRCSLSRIGAS